VICAKRGGDTQVRDHSEWLHTVPKKPDAVDFSFIPITSLLKGLPGKGFLSHAINLYLRCKFSFIFSSSENLRFIYIFIKEHGNIHKCKLFL